MNVVCCVLSDQRS